jgi:hypothetical protein
MNSTLRWTRPLLAFTLFLSLFVWSGRADAYAWMIRHDYTGCAQCHADPSGGGLLTLYGRAQSELLLRSQYTKRGEDEDPGTIGNFLFGVPLPESLLLGGDYRGMYMSNHVSGAPTLNQFIQMQADLEGQVTVGRFRVNGSLGYDHTGAQAAWLTTRPQDNLVSRVYWLGLDLGEDKQFLLRAGRMNIPFGIRSIEHTLFIHTPPTVPGGGVGDDINSGQQLGAALSYNGEGVRGEIMGIQGNYQVTPDEYRQRGYAGYIEWDPSVKVAAGLSSMITEVQKDPTLQTPLIRHAHGLFARWAPWRPLTFLAEEDLLIDSQPINKTPKGQPSANVGHAGMLQADYEPWQGIHLMATGELTRPPVYNAGTSLAVWGSFAWFFAPHMDARFDAIQQSLALGTGPNTSATTLLFQFHAFL